jgi:hypothetical protein
MEGFKSNTKMKAGVACYKEGGSVKYKSRHSEKSEMKEDVAQDKAIVKKAVKMHDEQLHGGKETDLKKLKNGGRMKKEGGCVGRYKSGGGVSYGAKKTEEDRKEIAAIKRMKPKMKADGGVITDEERARMPAGKLPQQIVDEEATKENTETREMVAGPLRKLKQGIMETFKSKIKTPMKKGGKAC